MEAIRPDQVVARVSQLIERPSWDAIPGINTFLTWKQRLENVDAQVLQTATEMGGLIELLRQEAPTRVLEIGGAFGGWGYVVSGIAGPHMEYIVIDPTPRGPFTSKVTDMLQEQGVALTHLRKKSQDAVVDVVKLLDGKQVDILHIDGDHGRAKQDFALYRQFVRPGGYVIFHDILYSREASDVTPVWADIRRGFYSVEFCAAQGGNQREGRYTDGKGIGAIRMPCERKV
ncbi:unnamed protein product [marine sediment metagenome]|uniref:O-methyltransferase domain-containing protein n=1 Tax=marine sediment metagenome TaxID=412755 RepID=X0S2P3_9ZZZZ